LLSHGEIGSYTREFTQGEGKFCCYENAKKNENGKISSGENFQDSDAAVVGTYAEIQISELALKRLEACIA